MGRFWSILFFLVPILGGGALVMAAMGIAPLVAVGFPPSIGDKRLATDQLISGLQVVAAAVLLAAGLMIGYVIWRFDHRRSPDSKRDFVHQNSKIEIGATLIPTCLLFCLATIQIAFWNQCNVDRPVVTVDGETVPHPPIALVKANRFGWEFSFAGADGRLATQDDIYVENLLVLPANEDIVLQLESRDVIHSFCVSELRLNQEVIPGRTQFVTFHANRTCDIEIRCAELCGRGHYQMKADLRLVDREIFDQWLADQAAAGTPEYQSAAAPDGVG